MCPWVTLVSFHKSTFVTATKNRITLCFFWNLEQLAWWQLWEKNTLIILVAAILGLLLTVIVICCIIICICRRRRRQDKCEYDKLLIAIRLLTNNLSNTNSKQKLKRTTKKLAQFVYHKSRKWFLKKKDFVVWLFYHKLLLYSVKKKHGQGLFKSFCMIFCT